MSEAGNCAIKRLRDRAKAAFEAKIAPDEHVRGFASVGDQERGVANARQEFGGHYLDLCATYWHLDGLECAREYGRRVVDGAARAMSDDGYVGGETAERRMEGFSLWNQSHAVYGLLRFAEAANDDKARALGLRAAEWLLRALGSMSPEELIDSRTVWNGNRDRIVLLTKCCDVLDGGKRVVVTAERIRREVDESLKTLGTDHVDILLLHRDDPAHPVAEYIETLEALRREGK